MKNFLLTSLLFWIAGSGLLAQQSKFLDRSKNKSDTQYNSSTVFIEPGGELDLNSISNDSEHLILELAFDPESTDEAKAKYIRQIVADLDKISANYAGYTIITVQVGEQIFLTAGEVKALGDSYKKKAKKNLSKAWEVLNLTQKFPKARIYGFNWNW
ncbi:MAG: hypothetical protein ACO1O6_01615 [Bacteroidota bacterium]